MKQEFGITTNNGTISFGFGINGSMRKRYNK